MKKVQTEEASDGKLLYSGQQKLVKVVVSPAKGAMLKRNVWMLNPTKEGSWDHNFLLSNKIIIFN